jgi:hypothetical protein
VSGQTRRQAQIDLNLRTSVTAVGQQHKVRSAVSRAQGQDLLAVLKARVSDLDVRGPDGALPMFSTLTVRSAWSAADHAAVAHHDRGKKRGSHEDHEQPDE